MTASRLGYSKAFTKLVFILLKDTGWYEVTDSYYDGMPFGYKMGCKFSSYFCYDPPEGVTPSGPNNLS